VSETIVEVVTVEASTLTVDVVVSPPVAAIDVVAPPPAAVVIELVEFAGPPIGYPQLPAELRQLPISFPFGDRPGAGSVVNVPMGFTVTVPAGLAGTRVWSGARASANATFTLNRLSGITVTLLGTITITPATNTSCILAGPGGTVPAGDVMQILVGAQDATLADVGITVMANRV
jgi:hypothetical protein